MKGVEAVSQEKSLMVPQTSKIKKTLKMYSFNDVIKKTKNKKKNLGWSVK